MRRILLLVAITTVNLQFLYGEDQKSTSNDLTEAEFLKIASCTLSGESGQKPFLVISEMFAGPIHLRQVLSWKGPDQAALLILDGIDDTPILVIAGGQAIFYDPMANEIKTVKDFGFQAVFKLEGDTLQANFGGKEGGNNLIDLNFGSVLHGSTGKVKIAKGKDQTFVYDGASKTGNSQCYAVVSRTATIPLQRMDLFHRGDGKNGISFTRIDGDVSLALPFFSSPIERVQKLTIPSKAASSEESMKFSQAVMRGVFFRAAIADPSARKQLEPLLPPEFNWKDAERRNAEASKTLREIFIAPFTELGIQQSGANQPSTRPVDKSEGGAKPQAEAEGRSR